MSIKVRYRHLTSFPRKRTEDLQVCGAGIRTSALWHDRYVSRLSPDLIARDREIPLAAVYEALDYCQEHWEAICREKDAEAARLRRRGFFAGRRAGLA